ncbi:MAG: metallophosphoesterase family protein [Lachnospiraceae bacterium]|nr:metallophosphoesterase family protein [Lachnospiraceae bacterium]
MRILVVADEPSKWLWDFYEDGKLAGIDLILSCGDLPAEYLSFLVTFANCPLLYVNGNHDHYDKRPPEGCICIDDQVYEYEGVRILGLGGSMRYKPGQDNQYTEKEMRKRVGKLFFPIMRKRGFDILLTHAPAKGLGDLEDRPHRGFQVFLDLMKKHRPKYFFYGHVHLNYGSDIKREQKYLDTQVVNAYEKYFIEI